MAGDGFALRTLDGGRRWRIIYGGDEDVTHADFLSRNVGWLLGQSGLVRTVNGRTWSQMGEPHGSLLLQIDFVNDTSGLGIGASNAGTTALFRTTNAGRTWSAVSTPAQPIGVAQEGHVLWLASGRALWYRRTGGRRWMPAMSDVPLGPRRSTLGYGHAWIAPAGRASVWVEFQLGEGAGGSEAWALYRADTSGDHKCVASNQTICPAPSGLQSSYPPLLSSRGSRLLLVTVCWACNSTVSGDSYVVSDDSIQHVASVPNADPWAMSFGDRRRGYLVTSGWGLERTADGGRTWKSAAAGYGTS